MKHKCTSGLLAWRVEWLLKGSECERGWSFPGGPPGQIWGSPPPWKWKGCGEKGGSHSGSTPPPPWGEGEQEAVWQGREGQATSPVPRPEVLGCGHGAARGLCALGGASVLSGLQASPETQSQGNLATHGATGSPATERGSSYIRPAHAWGAGVGNLRTLAQAPPYVRAGAGLQDTHCAQESKPGPWLVLKALPVWLTLALTGLPFGLPGLAFQLSQPLTIAIKPPGLCSGCALPRNTLVPQLWLVISLVCVFHHCSPGAPTRPPWAVWQVHLHPL